MAHASHEQQFPIAGNLAVIEWCARVATAAAARNEDNKCELVDSGLATAFVTEMQHLSDRSEASAQISNLIWQISCPHSVWFLTF